MTIPVRTSPKTPAHHLGRAAPAPKASARPRPDLPSWFRGATTCLYAVSGSLATLLTALALVAAMSWAPAPLTGAAALLLAVMETAFVLGTGAWCFTVAGTRRVDPTTPQFRPVWFIAGWLIPVAHIIVPHRMLGDLWASAKWQQSDRTGTNSPLAARPWIISGWASAWGAGFVMVLTVFFGDVGMAFLATCLGVFALSTALLGRVVHAIARELD